MANERRPTLPTSAGAWAMFDDPHRGRLCSNPAGAVHGIPQFDPAYARGVREALDHMDKAHEKQATQREVDCMAIRDPLENTKLEASKFESAQ